MQNLPSSTPPAPSNAGTPKKPPSHPLFRNMFFNDSGNSAPRAPPPVRATQPAYASNSNANTGRGDKNFMFTTSMRPHENTQPGTPNRSMRTMNIPETAVPTALKTPDISPQTNNYSLRLERRPASEKQEKAARAKAQAQADAAKLRAKVKAEADVKARAAARTTARAAAKTAALHRAQRAKEEAAIARSRIPTWERSKFDADQNADPSDKPYGV